MKNIENIKIFQTSTLNNALKKMADGGIKIVLVIDKEDKLLGTLSDGDIRRGLLNGMDLNSTIASFIICDNIIFFWYHLIRM